jgi:hypothetical protein
MSADTVHSAPRPKLFGRWRRWRERGVQVDATAYLTIWLVLLYGVSAAQVFAPLGDLGAPATMFAFAAPLVWLSARILPSSGLDHGRQPMRVMLLLYAWYMLVSLTVAWSRPLTEIESMGVARGVILGVTFSGVGLLVADGVETRDRLDTLLRRVVLAGAFLAGLGIAQFFTGVAFQIDLPGLVWNHLPGGVSTRSLFNRPQATTLHPIEFSVVTAALLPLALHYAFHAKPGAPRQRAVFYAGVIGFAVPLSLSRSGLVAVAVAMLVMFSGWSWARRWRAMAFLVAAIPVLWIAIPGLVGTLASMFQNTETDDSIQGRVERIPLVAERVRERPWLGRGESTFNLEDYFVIDNAIYGKLIETGVIGLALILALFLTGWYLGLAVRHQPRATPEDMHLGRALAGGIIAVTASLATFDAFGYRILIGTLFLLLGAAGALWRLTSDHPGHGPPSTLR